MTRRYGTKESPLSLKFIHFSEKPKKNMFMK